MEPLHIKISINDWAYVRIYIYIYIVGFCTNIIPNVSNNVQREIDVFNLGALRWSIAFGRLSMASNPITAKSDNPVETKFIDMMI